MIQFACLDFSPVIQINVVPSLVARCIREAGLVGRGRLFVLVVKAWVVADVVRPGRGFGEDGDVAIGVCPGVGVGVLVATTAICRGGGGKGLKGR